MKKELLHITINHTGKMEGMQSLSTSAICNPNCQNNRNIDGSICQHCYACAMQKRYSNLTNVLVRNGETLSTDIIPCEDLPRINAAVFRLEAFGDLINENHLINYLNICRKNPLTRFALWTKHFHVCDKVFGEMGIEKPANLKIIASSLMVNQPIKRPAWADSTFTVFSSEKEAEKLGRKINCGKRKCMDCLRCYIENGDVNELLK